VALFAIEPESKRITQKQMLQARQTGAASGEWEVATEQGKVLMKSYPSITNEDYRFLDRRS
jgi:hypothetical protein